MMAIRKIIDMFQNFMCVTFLGIGTDFRQTDFLLKI